VSTVDFLDVVLIPINQSAFIFYFILFVFEFFFAYFSSNHSFGGIWFRNFLYLK